LVAAGLVALGLAVPASLALLGKWESTKQFLTDRSEPAYAKNIVRKWDRQTGYKTLGLNVQLIALNHALTAQTPNGEAGVYALRFDHNLIGFAVLAEPKRNMPHIPLADFFSVLPTSKAVEGRTNTILYHGCPPGWALQRLDGGTAQIGKTYGYLIGRAAPRVASVQILYQDGSTTQGAVGNGYFLTWMKPSAGWTNVTLIAKDAPGKTIARLVSGGYGGIPFLPAKPRSPFACAP
jgi:hypothetical protein